MFDPEFYLIVFSLLACWWIVNLSLLGPRVRGVPWSIIFSLPIGWVIHQWDLDVIQVLSIGGLLASLVKLSQYKSNLQMESAAAFFSIVMTVFILVLNIWRDGDPVHFSSMFLLISVLVFWIHTRVCRTRKQSLHWLDRTGAFVAWFSIAVCFLCVCEFLMLVLNPTDQHGLGIAIGMGLCVGIGVYGSLAVGLGMWLKLLANPNPNWKFVIFGFLFCIVGIVVALSVGGVLV